MVGAVGPRIVNPDGTLYPSARSVPRRCRTPSATACSGMVAPGETASAGATGCSTGITPSRRRGRLGVRGLLPRPPGGMGRGRRLRSRHTSCTWRTWTCAGAWAAPGGRWRTSRGRRCSTSGGVGRPAPLPDVGRPPPSRCGASPGARPAGLRRLALPLVGVGLTGRFVPDRPGDRRMSRAR